MARNKVDREHILSLAKAVDCGILAPPMDAQVAVYELCRYFLGEDWYVSYSCGAEQANTEIVYAIESSYRGCRKRKSR
jgi:hypothetical protein